MTQRAQNQRSYQLFPELQHSLCRVLVALLMLSTPVFGQSYRVDIQDTDIRDFAGMLSKITGQRYVLDSRVTGKLNIHSEQQLNEEELINLFTTELKLRGFNLVQVSEHGWKVVPEQKARTEATAVTDKDDNTIAFDQMVTRVVHLEHVNAVQLASAMKNLVDRKTGHLFSYGASNSLIIVTGRGHSEQLAELARQLDRQGSREVKTYCLKHADASTVSTSLSSLMSDTVGNTGNRRNQPSFMADIRSNCVLVGTNPEMWKRIQPVLEQLDSELRQDNRSRVFYLKYARADSLLKVIKGIAKGVQVKGGGSRSEEVFMEAHPENNALVLSGPARQTDRLGQIIAQLDIQRAQVHVEAIIVELSDQTAKELGVQWLFGKKKLPVGGSGFRGSSAPSILDLAGDLAAKNKSDAARALANSQGLLLGLGHLSPKGNNFAVLINALQADSDSNVLSTPSLMVLDNEEASILVGNNIPVITGSVTGDNNSNPFTTVKREDVGVKLRITPQINDADTIRLKILQEVSALAPRAGVKDVVTSKREIRTTVQVNDGDTIILGGLTSEELVEVENRVPLLGDIPIIGNLFRSRDVSRKKRHLAVFLQPSVIRTQDEVRDFTGDKYSYIRARQLLRQQESIAMMPDATRPVLPERQQDKPDPQP